MQTVREADDLAKALSACRARGERIAMVPTMGALHEGHLALVAKARELADRVVVSIFVNPMQFNNTGDLSRYPRQEAKDAEQLEAMADLLWLPSSEQLYPADFASKVHVDGVSDRWEGEFRPGHFDGVATVVAKLFIAVLPNIALFGEKDFQQLAVIRRMTADLGIPVEVLGMPTVRADDGLALSSRNALLTPEERAAAPALPQALTSATDMISGGGDVRQALEAARQTIAAAGFGPIDYVALVDSATLEPLAEYRPGSRLIAAAFLGKVRLIDNMPVA